MSENLPQEFVALHNQFKATTPRCRLWSRTQTALLVMQLAPLAYDMTLPAFMMLSMPFFWCFLLAMIPLGLIFRERDLILMGMHSGTTAMTQRNDEHYRMITGEERR